MSGATRVVKPKTDREKAAANFVLKGALTRIALMFQMSGRSFTGEEVAGILISLQQAHEHGTTLALSGQQEAPAIDAEVQL